MSPPALDPRDLWEARALVLEKRARARRELAPALDSMERGRGLDRPKGREVRTVESLVKQEGAAWAVRE